MSMIRGRIETEREIAPKEISFGNIPFHKNESGDWVSDDPEMEVIVTDLWSLLNEMSNGPDKD
jgi:hypothetical protein